MLEALEATALATWLRHSVVAYPLVSAAHIMAVGTLFAAVLAMDLRLMGGLARLPAGVVAEIVEPAAVAALLAAAASGGLLFAVGATDYVANPAFRIKAVLLALALVNVVAVRASGRWRRFKATGAGAPGLALHAGLSLAVWSGVLVAGRFVGFL